MLCRSSSFGRLLRVLKIMLVCLSDARMQLNTQIQQLEKYLRATSVNDEQRTSNFSASTATSSAVQYETPLAVPFKIDPTRLDAQFYAHSVPNGFDRGDPSSVSFFSADRCGASAASLEREPYVPKYIEVTYIEGSNDKKWSSRDFPWTKKLEVCIPICAIASTERDMLLIPYNASIWSSVRQITKEYLAIIPFVLIKEK